MLGFFFALNDTGSAGHEELPDDQRIALEQLNSRAHHLLQDALPSLPEWQRTDPQGDFTYSPFEVCEDHADPALDGELAAYSFWVYSETPIDPSTGRAIKDEVIRQYEAACRERGAQCRYLHAESQVTEEVTTSSPADL